MNRLTITKLFTLVVATLAPGCSDLPLAADDPAVADVQLASQQRNDQEANGARLNGARLNGARLNGARLNGPLAGVALNVDGSRGTLRVTNAATGQPLTPTELVGAQFQVELADGSTAQVVLDSYRAIAAPQQTLDAYVVLAADTGQSICGYDGDGRPQVAVPIGYGFDPVTGSQISSPGNFTFACRGGAIEKCLEWGYPKWLIGVETFSGVTQVRPLSMYHAACVHLVRADFCGDGVAHTFTGTLIDVYDNLQIQLMSTYNGVGGWYNEAEWAPDGAWCITKTRWMPQALPATVVANESAANPDWAYIQAQCPWRIAGNPWPGNPDGTGSPRACGDSSTLMARNGFYLPEQGRRSLLGSHSGLYQY